MDGRDRASREAIDVETGAGALAHHPEDGSADTVENLLMRYEAHRTNYNNSTGAAVDFT